MDRITKAQETFLLIFSPLTHFLKASDFVFTKDFGLFLLQKSRKWLAKFWKLALYDVTEGWTTRPRLLTTET